MLVPNNISILNIKQR